MLGLLPESREGATAAVVAVNRIVSLSSGVSQNFGQEQSALAALSVLRCGNSLSARQPSNAVL